jgi:hypothetical protein
MAWRFYTDAGQIKKTSSPSNLGDLSDVNAGSVTDGSLLRYEGSVTEWQNTTSSNLLLSDNGRLQVPTDGTSAGIQIGADVVMFRAAADDLRLESNDSLILQAGTGRFGKLATGASSAVQLLRTYDTSGTPGTVFEVNEDGQMEWGGAGTGALDTILKRPAAGELELTGPATQAGTRFHLRQNASIAGDAVLEVSAAGASNDSTLQLQSVTMTSSTTDSNKLTITASSGVDLPSATASSTGLTFGSTDPVTLYRSAANTLSLSAGDQIQVQQDPSAANDLARKSYVDALDPSGVYLPLAGGTMAGDVTFPDTDKIALDATTSSTRKINLKVSGESFNRIEVAPRFILFGPGTSAVDTTLWRPEANVLGVANPSYWRTGEKSGTSPYTNVKSGLVETYVNPETFSRMTLDGQNTSLSFGDGSAAADWSMSRTAANTVALASGDTIQVQQDPVVANDVTRKSYVNHRAYFLGG